VTDVIPVFTNPWRLSWVTPSVAAREGKKTDEGTMVRPLDFETKTMAVGDPLEAQTLTSATTKPSSDIPTNCKTCCEIAHKI
jgi:hypothetical protein